jgi:hypothetical protein
MPADLLEQLGVMHVTEPAHKAARSRYIVDTACLSAVVEQFSRYLLNQ